MSDALTTRSTWASPSMLRVGWTLRGSGWDSVRLGHEIGLMPPGVAANLVEPAYIAAGQGRRDDAMALAAEAGAIAEASSAHAIPRQVGTSGSPA